MDVDGGLQKEARLVFLSKHYSKGGVNTETPLLLFWKKKKKNLITSSSNNLSDDRSPEDVLTSSEQRSSYSTLSNAQLDAGNKATSVTHCHTEQDLQC